MVQKIKNYFSNTGLRHKKEFHKKVKSLDAKFHSGDTFSQPLFKERNCVVCNENNFKYIFTNPSKFDYYCCENCRMVIMNPIPSDENLGILYNSEEMSFNTSGGKTKKRVQPANQEDLNYILKYIQTGKHLDIGCGIGKFIMASSSHFLSEGLEINKEHAAIGIENDLTIHNTYSSEFKPQTKYDLISMLQVIEHLSDPVSVIKDGHRLLRKGGLMYIACPNYSSASFALFKEKHRHVSSFAHINLYSMDTLKKQMEDLGFECINIETYFLDIDLHDLIYYYFNRNNFSHRFANYNEFLFTLTNKLFRPFKGVLQRNVVKKNKGSYLRGVFRKIN